MVIVLPQQLHGGIQLALRNRTGARQHDGLGGFHLIVVELTEVLHINLDLAGIHHRNGVIQHHIMAGDLLHSRFHIGQLAHAGGLNHDPVRMVLLDHLMQGLAEIAHQGAADAAGVHLRNVNTRILQKAAVNADLTELVFDQHQLLSTVGFLNHFLDQGCLSRPKKAGINIDFCHGNTFCFYIYGTIIPPFVNPDNTKKQNSTAGLL